MGWQELSLLQAFIASWTRGVPIILRGDSNALKPRPAHVTALHQYISRERRPLWRLAMPMLNSIFRVTPKLG